MSADGGSAFPQVCTDDPDERRGESFPNTYSTGGMSLRDWFAGQALSNPRICDIQLYSDNATNVRRAYAIADAMLEARQQPKENFK